MAGYRRLSLFSSTFSAGGLCLFSVSACQHFCFCAKEVAQEAGRRRSTSWPCTGEQRAPTHTLPLPLQPLATTETHCSCLYLPSRLQQSTAQEEGSVPACSCYTEDSVFAFWVFSAVLVRCWIWWNGWLLRSALARVGTAAGVRSWAGVAAYWRTAV